MKGKINLIPQEMAVNKTAAKAEKFISSLTAFFLFAVIAGLVVIVGLFFLFSSQLKGIEEEVASLSTQIQALEKSEQKLVLAKDKVDKISQINQLPTSDAAVKNFKTVSSLIADSTEASISELDIQPTKIETSIGFTSSSSFSSFFNSLSQNTLFKRIILASLAFNPNTGYVAGLILENK